MKTKKIHTNEMQEILQDFLRFANQVPESDDLHYGDFSLSQKTLIISPP